MRIRQVAAVVMWTAGVAACAQGASPAGAQRSGVSHPEQIPVTTSPEGIAQPVVYEGAPAEQMAAPVKETVVLVPETPSTLR